MHTGLRFASGSISCPRSARARRLAVFLRWLRALLCEQAPNDAVKPASGLVAQIVELRGNLMIRSQIERFGLEGNPPFIGKLDLQCVSVPHLFLMQRFDQAPAHAEAGDAEMGV